MFVKARRLPMMTPAKVERKVNDSEEGEGRGSISEWTEAEDEERRECWGDSLFFVVTSGS
jgi:hypothetical protein